jgi:hypothetical protein
MSCPFLEYRSSDDEHEFDHERPYCTAKSEFVSPMMADICNDRDRFDHEEHCETYKDAVEGKAEAEPTPADD